MADLAHFDVGSDLAGLFADVLQTWPEEDDLRFIREYLDHGEYGEALENLVAVGLRNGVGFTRDQVRRLNDTAAVMHMEGSPWLVQLSRPSKDVAPGM